MRRAHDVTDQELRNFAEWFLQRFKKKETRREWFEVSVEGAFQIPVRDVKDIVKRMERLNLVSVKRTSIRIINV